MKNMNDLNLNQFQMVDYLKTLGVRFDKKTCQLKLNENLFPKLSYDKNFPKKVTLSYPSPNNNEFGQQHFPFDELIFLNAFEDKKYQNFQSKQFYKSFDAIFFGENYKNANDYVKFIFKYFSVNPTNVQKALSKSYSNKKTKHKKIIVNPKPQKILKEIFGVDNYSSGLNPRNSKGKQNSQGEPLSPASLNAISNLEAQLHSIAKKAASDFDLNKYFFDFQSVCKKILFIQNPKKYNSNFLKHLPPKEIYNISKKFAEMVDNIQKSML